MPAPNRFVLLAGLLVTLQADGLLAQVAPQGAPTGMLTPATSNAEAASAVKSALDDYLMWNFQGAARQTARALELEPSFGLARTLRTITVGGTGLPAEFARAASEASSASAVEALMALGAREINAGRAAGGRRIYATAVELAPNDVRLATWHAAALAGAARVEALRAVAAKNPSDVSSRLWLVFYLTPAIDSIALMNADEAVRVAQEAIRLAPRSSATHVMLAHVQMQLRRYDDARQHLNAAATLEPRTEYGYELQALLASIENRQADMRLALDSAIALSPNAGRLVTYRRARALTHLSEKRPQAALAELAPLAKEAEATARPAAALTTLFMATVSAASRDAAGAEQHLQTARDLGATGTTLHDYETNVYSLTGQAAKARAALENYIRVAGPRPELTPAVNATRETNVHRLSGMVLVAERKPQEAIAELKQGGDNPYVTLYLVEAYRQLRDNKQADAALKAFWDRAELTFVSTGVPTMRYRYGK